MLRYKFLGSNFISSLTKKIPTQAHKLFWAYINISHILLKYSPRFWAPTNIPHTSPINYLRPSHKYYPHIIQLGLSTKNTHHITTKIGPQNYTISTKSPKSFTLWEKSKKPNKTLLRACCKTTPLKPIVTQHI